jgi:predicted nucleic acid-binding protein
MKSGPALTVCFDTNVLIYAFTADDARHRIASLIVTNLASQGGSLPSQVLREFLAVVHRKAFMPLVAAREVIKTLENRFDACASNSADLIEASKLAERHRLNFYDAFICVVARRAGASTLLSEDMKDGAVLDGLRIINPFADGNRETLIGLGLI